MILDEIKSYLIAHPNSSRKALSKHFAISEEGVAAMVEVWIRKGKVKTVLSEKSGAADVHYKWLSDGELAVTISHS